ncbi:hypothetical protein P691DRAFT_804805 [Macrolepiota fuliginosa MF-IS2]|uniref:Gag protein n=1 Tax=Macrolepiota fuliginosa MF-IS2 TaxID=1400762 RepID=A0A9P5X707_9AGAR|nr:hypothetical protein P691DRAFT_804805 [Macrolepiota fuliginosa MF-IS2]
MDFSLIATLPKLTGPESYLFWAHHVKDALASTRVQGSDCTAWDLSGNHIVPTASTDAVELARRVILASQALSIINHTLPDAIAHHGISDPRTLWARLHVQFGTPSPAAVYADFLRTMAWRITGNRDPSIDIVELETIYTRLASNGVFVDEFLRAMTLLRAIPPEWSSVASTILVNRTSVADITWDLVREAIQAEWIRSTTHAQREGQRRGNAPRRSNNHPDSVPYQQHRPQQQHSQGQGQQYKNQNNQGKRPRGTRGGRRKAKEKAAARSAQEKNRNDRSPEVRTRRTEYGSR